MWGCIYGPDGVVCGAVSIITSMCVCGGGGVVSPSTPD